MYELLCIPKSTRFNAAKYWKKIRYNTILYAGKICYRVCRTNRFLNRGEVLCTGYIIVEHPLL